MDLSHPISTVIPSLEGQVLTVLAHTTAPMSGSAIARLTDAGSERGCRRALERLVRQGTVEATASGPSILYVANRQHMMWPTIERVVEAADRARQDLFTRFRHIVSDDFGERATLAVFGSVARRDSALDSDIDLLLVTPDDADPDAVDRVVDRLIRHGREWTGNDTNVYQLTTGELTEHIRQGDPMIASWHRDARTISGSDLTAQLTVSPS